MRPLPPTVYRLQCVVHRASAGGIVLHDEQIVEHAEAAAIERAKARFSHLSLGRSGSAALRDDAGRCVWAAQETVSARD